MSLLKIALPNEDITGSTPDKFSINSLFPNPKVSMVAQPPHAGLVNINWSSTTLGYLMGQVKVMFSFPHGYNYIPTVFGTCHFDNGTNRTDGFLPFQVGSLGVIIIDGDRVNVNIKWVSLDLANPPTAIPPFILNVRYYVFAERGYNQSSE